jgi:hypothetical protein
LRVFIIGLYAFSFLIVYFFSSFLVISGHSDRILYQVFDNWLEERRILADFNLTNALIQQLFSELDPHKKGFLTKNDWISAFSKYNWNDQILGEITDILISNFSDLNSSFLFFLHGERGNLKTDISTSSLVFAQFLKGINALLPEKYSDGEIRKIWNRCIGTASSGDSLNYNKFKLLFDHPSFQNKPISL